MGFRFTYTVPGAGTPGLVADINNATVDSYLSNESEGIEPGNFVFVIPGSPLAAQRRSAERRHRGGGRKIAGCVQYLPGRPREPSRSTWEQYDALPVVRQGRIWTLVEAFAPASIEAALDAWFIRFTDSPAPAANIVPGNLRYGNGDPTPAPADTCVAIPAGILRPIRTAGPAVGGLTLVEVEFDFRNAVTFG